MRSPLYLRAARQGLITPLGPRGAALAPTSSVRTLYHPALPWFLKCSIHVRLTNCIRKNAWYELESAVTLSALLNEDFRQLEHAVPGLTILREPNATTLDFSPLARADEQEAVRHLQECFGILYRQALPLSVREDGQTALAGTLFGLDRDGASPLQRLIRELAATRALDYRETALLWLDHYLTLLLPSVLTAFFDRGIVFEPHLQNVLIGLQDHLPCRLWLRDLEEPSSTAPAGTPPAWPPSPTRRGARSATPATRAGSAPPTACSSTISPRPCSAWPTAIARWSSGYGIGWRTTCSAGVTSRRSPPC